MNKNLDPESVAGQLLAIKTMQSVIIAMLAVASNGDREDRINAIHASVIDDIQKAVDAIEHAGRIGAAAINTADNVFGLALNIVRTVRK